MTRDVIERASSPGERGDGMGIVTSDVLDRLRVSTLGLSA
jgi:hypothetical protein